jgi:hypothetical protein
MPLATSPVRTVHGTFTGNQYTFEVYCGEDISSPVDCTREEDCSSKSVSLTCLTGLFCDRAVITESTISPVMAVTVLKSCFIEVCFMMIIQLNQP